jgi:hypothetical protein
MALTTNAQLASFTARTTGVSNPVRSPGFRGSASVSAQVAAFASGVPPDLYAFHHSTRNSTTLCCTLAHQSRLLPPSLAGRFHNQLDVPPTRPLRPVTPDNARVLRFTAAAGT